MIVIINYGLGNLVSIQNMLKKIGVRSVITSDIATSKEASKLILPGVGSFDAGMKNLKELNLINTLRIKILEEKTPVLGICLGMQLMCQKSDEGTEPGLGWFNAELVRFNQAEGLKVPHMNWADTRSLPSSKIFNNMFEDPRFYYVHSYHIKDTPADSTLYGKYNGFEFVSGLERDNMAGVQFHPEKSHRYGMKLLQNFIENF